MADVATALFPGITIVGAAPRLAPAFPDVSPAYLSAVAYVRHSLFLAGHWERSGRLLTRRCDAGHARRARNHWCAARWAVPSVR